MGAKPSLPKILKNYINFIFSPMKQVWDSPSSSCLGPLQTKSLAVPLCTIHRGIAFKISLLNYFPQTFGKLNNEQGETFHQGIETMEAGTKNNGLCSRWQTVIRILCNIALADPNIKNLTKGSFYVLINLTLCISNLWF